MTLEEIRAMLAAAASQPWHAEDDGQIVAGDGHAVADFVPFASERRLAAAAPEIAALLVRAVEVLQDMVEKGDGTCLVDPPCGYCAACRARALLAELGVQR